MGLQTLVAAIDFLEFQEAVSQQAQLSQRNISQYSQQPQQILNSTTGQRIQETHHSNQIFIPEGQQNPTFVVPNPISVSIDAKAMRRKILHNNLEKDRRANMRLQMEELKGLLPPPTTHSGVPYGRLTTTYSTLARSVMYIKELEEKEKEYKMEIEELNIKRAKMEQQIAELMKKVELSDYNTEIIRNAAEIKIEVEPMPGPTETSDVGSEDIFLCFGKSDYAMKRSKHCNLETLRKTRQNENGDHNNVFCERSTSSFAIPLQYNG